MRTHSSPRGTTIIEAMIAMAVMLLGFLGLASLQVVAARSNQFSKKMNQATALATDLADNLKSWNYNDTRLTPLAGLVTSVDAAAIKDKWELGRNEAASYVAQFSDKATDSNATNSNALGAAYTGMSGDIDGDGTLDFIRYWNVFAYDSDNDGEPNGKFIQIIVRWREGPLGFRQVTTMAFRPDPSAMLE